MATMDKYQNISVQQAQCSPSIKTTLELPRVNLSDADLMKKSTSDRTKRRVAHIARFPLPVINRSMFVPDQNKRKKKDNSKTKPVHVHQLCLKITRTKSDKGKKSKKNGVAISKVTQAKKTSVSSKKRKTEDTDNRIFETPKKRQKIYSLSSCETENVKGSRLSHEKI